MKLVNEHTWKDLPENIEWGNAVCKALAASKVPDEHVAAVRRNVSGTRMRPFEVAGAAYLGHKHWPADFNAVQEPAKFIAMQLVDICPLPPPVTSVAVQG